MRRLLPGLVLLAALSGCVKPPPPPPANGPAFHPETWFQGRMHSSGALKAITRPAAILHVDSLGAPEREGAVRLDQAIHWGGGKTDHRFWIMKRKPGGGYDVSLSDAKGPVFFETSGPRAHLRYRDRRGPITIEQWMDLQPDGVTLKNVGALTVLGVPVARLDETIVHDRR